MGCDKRVSIYSSLVIKMVVQPIALRVLIRANPSLTLVDAMTLLNETVNNDREAFDQIIRRIWWKRFF